MKKIVIFGATGNLGAYLTLYIQQYYKNTYEVIAVGQRNTSFFDKYGIDYYAIDIQKAENFEQLSALDIDAVVNLAAIIPANLKIYNPNTYFNVNTIGMLNILNWCKNNDIKKVIYTQTIFDIEYHLNNYSRVSSNIERKFNYCGDHSIYVISKNAAVDLLKHYHYEFGLQTFILRIPHIYNYTSPYYLKDGIVTKKPLHILIDKAINSEPIEIWGDQNYQKDMVYVADFSQMVCKCIDVKHIKHGIYNVGTNMPVSIEKQIKTIIDIFSPSNCKSTISYNKNKLLTKGHGLLDISNAVEELGYKPEYDCEKLFMEYKKEMELNRFKELLDRQ